MSTGLWIILAILSLVILAAVAEAFLRRGKHRKLSSIRPEKRYSVDGSKRVPLGMEATDLSPVNATQRRNEEIESRNDRATWANGKRHDTHLTVRKVVNWVKRHS